MTIHLAIWLVWLIGSILYIGIGTFFAREITIYQTWCSSFTNWIIPVLTFFFWPIAFGLIILQVILSGFYLLVFGRGL